MSVPVTKSLYCDTASFSGTTFGGLLEVAPPDTNTTWGWNTGQNNPPLYCEMNRGIEVSRTSAQWQASPTQSVPNQNTRGSGAGNCWIAGPYTGEFLSGNWNVSMSVKAVSNPSNHNGQLIYRFWTSPTGSGAGASLVTASFISSSIATITDASTIWVLTSSVSLPRINMKNSYLLVQTYWRIITAGGNNNADNDFVLGTNNSVITTTPFVTSEPSVIAWEQSDS